VGVELEIKQQHVAAGCRQWAASLRRTLATRGISNWPNR
jgi:hypothetical protein